MNHDWSYHHHEASGWHGNIQCDVQHYKCRLCGTTKQMPAQGDIKPPLIGCNASFVEIKPIIKRQEDLVDKGDDDDYSSQRKFTGNRGKKNNR